MDQESRSKARRIAIQKGEGFPEMDIKEIEEQFCWNNLENDRRWITCRLEIALLVLSFKELEEAYSVMKKEAVWNLGERDKLEVKVKELEETLKVKQICHVEKKVRELEKDVKMYFDSCRLREESLFAEVERREKAETKIKELEKVEEK